MSWVEEDLVEVLAEAVHDRWMERRRREGWRPGPVRDDAELTHPGLVPYAALPDSEREYDRATVRVVVEELRRRGMLVPFGSEGGARHGA